MILRTKRSTRTAYRPLPAWKLQDAKAHFSQVVREAREQGPQRVTLHGKDAVVILSTEDYARLAPAAAQPSLMGNNAFRGQFGVVCADGSMDDGDRAEGNETVPPIRVGRAFVKLLAGSYMSRASTSIG